MFEGKEIRIILSKEADEVYKELNELVGDEKRRGVDSSLHQTLLRSINNVIDLLKKNPFSGNQISKKQIPERYSSKYNAENVWRIELPNRWRLIYTITGNEIEVINFVMDIFNHKEYDKAFGYKH
jgi:Txe/YoeB family toxin of Txe-Axe toxin-antitoxin module